MKKLVLMFVLFFLMSTNISAKTEGLESKRYDARGESEFNCNSWTNYKKAGSKKSTAKGLHKDFTTWTNASGMYMNVNSGIQTIKFTVGFAGASASVTVGNKAKSGLFWNAKKPKGKQYFRVLNNHPGNLVKYTKPYCPVKYKFERTAVNYAFEYK